MTDCNGTWISSLAKVATVLSILIALLSALAARRSARIAERALGEQRQSVGEQRRSADEQRRSADLSAFVVFLTEQYLDREFRSTAAPTINGVQYTSLRQAKGLAKYQLRHQEATWVDNSRKDKLGTWQNAVAFETAVALERIGAAAYSGLISLRLVLAIASETIVDDWIICQSWVQSYRQDREGETISRVGETGSATIKFQRRHAEWLTLVATAWLVKNWSGTAADTIERRLGGTENVREKIRELSAAESELMPDSVRADLKSLANVDM